MFGNLPVKLEFEANYYLVQPETFGPGFQLRFTFGPVVPLPW